jgi:hypothetical protein
MQLHTEAAENIPSMTVMSFLDTLWALPYTNQPQASADIMYDIVTIIKIRVTILSNCQTNRHVTSEYLAVHQTRMLSSMRMKPDKLYRLTNV